MCEVGEVYIFNYGLYISALENASMLKIKHFCSPGIHKHYL